MGILLRMRMIELDMGLETLLDQRFGRAAFENLANEWPEGTGFLEDRVSRGFRAVPSGLQIL